MNYKDAQLIGRSLSTFIHERKKSCESFFETMISKLSYFSYTPLFAFFYSLLPFTKVEDFIPHKNVIHESCESCETSKTCESSKTSETCESSKTCEVKESHTKTE